MNKLILILLIILLSNCASENLTSSMVEKPKGWSVAPTELQSQDDIKNLRGWWKGFNDETLNGLVDIALKESPDRAIAQNKILEARGISKYTDSALYPNLTARGKIGRRDENTMGMGKYPDNYFDTGFDALYELDLFGKNRKASEAAGANLNAIEQEYEDVSLTLIAEVARTYIDFREAQKQKAIAQKNLNTQEKTLSLVKDLFEAGATPRLNLERAENLVNTTRASIPEFNRLEQNARLRLSVLTGKLPENLQVDLSKVADIPSLDVAPALMTPASVLVNRPDVKAAEYRLLSASKFKESVAANIFPTFSLFGFYGITDSIIKGTTNIWNVALGTATSLVDFGNISGHVDTADAQEKQAFEAYRKSVLMAVVDVETALNDSANITEKYASLNNAYASAEKSLGYSNDLYKAGEIPFLDVLDAQRSANSAESALVKAQAEQAQSMVRIYKSFGVY